MQKLKDKTIVVAGGTGNVGSFIVRGLLNEGASVAVPSRSAEKINALRNHLESAGITSLERLITVEGNLSDKKEASRILDQISDQTGIPDAIISSLGYFIPAPSLLSVDLNDLQKVMDGYLIAHFKVARTFLPLFKEKGGTFIFINGPLAINPWEGSGLVSIATAGQQMLFKSLAKELNGSKARVSELMNYAYIRNRETQPGSKVKGEHVGMLASWMVSDAASDIHGKTIHLKTPETLVELGIESGL